MKLRWLMGRKPLGVGSINIGTIKQPCFQKLQYFDKEKQVWKTVPVTWVFDEDKKP